jgi:ABC-2 type transport system ATP-binding protein
LPPILDILNLHRSYGAVEALRGIQMTLSEPGVYGFLGPNGAGKTTTIKLIGGLLRPTAGRILINGVDNQRQPALARRGLGVMMESPVFYDHLSGRGNLSVLARLDGHVPGTQIDDLLARAGLAGKADAKVRTYSRGMRQRLAFAAALLGDPRLVILDEPANGLDPAGMVELRSWLDEMARRDGRAVFLSSHQMGEVERVCDRVTIIDRGCIIADGATDTIVRPKHSVVVRTNDVGRAQTRLRASLADAVAIEVIDRVTLRVRGASVTSAAVSRVLAQDGLDVNGVTEERESLEDAFFRLIGERHDVA